MKLRHVLKGLILVLLASCVNVDAAPLKMGGKKKNKNSGIVLEAPFTGRTVYLLDSKNQLSPDTLRQIKKVFAELLWIKIDTAELTFDEAISGEKSGLVLSLEKSGPWILSAPDNGWCRINVTLLKTDNPTEDIYATRLKKQIWRALASSLSVGNEQIQSVLSPAHSLRELDALPPVPTPDALNLFLKAAETHGLGRIRFVSYRTACQEGWAPAPTNEIQQAIWEQVRSDKERGPTNPIMITPKKK